MFRFRTNTNYFENNVYDVNTLENIALGYLDDETEARRVAEIAGRMRIGEIFIATDWGLWCLKEE